MVHVRITCHADLQDLQARCAGRMFLKLVSLESVRIAIDSYALLRNLIERRYWRCPQIDLLSLVAGMAVELHEIKDDLFPFLVVQEAKLGEDSTKALLLLKNSGVALQRLGEDAKEIVKKCARSLVELDGFLGKVQMMGGVLKDDVNQVLQGTRKFAWLQSRATTLLDAVDGLLSTAVCFPDSE
ncbi:unnamed protein product [Urochloa decumbens]|uniref:Uncharacterized protein n=1 Tax=Urochloa decumbens TaxID=240449 RepID=A0ABC8WCR0_9POAL